MKKKRIRPTNFRGRPQPAYADVDLTTDELARVAVQCWKWSADLASRKERFGGYATQSGTICQKLQQIIQWRKENKTETLIPGTYFKYLSALNYVLARAKPPAVAKNTTRRSKERHTAAGSVASQSHNPKGPYRILHLQQLEPVGESPKSAVEERKLVIFPDDRRINAGAGVLRHVRLGSGGLDRVKYSTFENDHGDALNYAPVRMYPTGPRLQLEFLHVPSNDPLENWWYVVIPLDFDEEGDEIWTPTDLTCLGTLLIMARAGNSADDFQNDLISPIELMVRLEDFDVNSDSKSQHQSTNWYRTRLPKWLYPVNISLDTFNWDQSAWPRNTKSVDRKSILQLTIGQEGAVGQCTGCIEISKIEFGE